MWTQETMGFSQSLIVSGLGLTIVFITLVALALAIMIVSKILAMMGIKPPVSKAAAAAPVASASQTNSADDEISAVLVSVISDAVQEPIDSFQITQIKQL